MALWVGIVPPTMRCSAKLVARQRSACSYLKAGGRREIEYLLLSRASVYTRRFGNPKGTRESDRGEIPLKRKRSFELRILLKNANCFPDGGSEYVPAHQ